MSSAVVHIQLEFLTLEFLREGGGRNSVAVQESRSQTLALPPAWLAQRARPVGTCR